MIRSISDWINMTFLRVVDTLVRSMWFVLQENAANIGERGAIYWRDTLSSLSPEEKRDRKEQWETDWESAEKAADIPDASPAVCKTWKGQMNPNTSAGTWAEGREQSS